ncbi:hypothetical protein RMSM_05877 [Rhodopirellula maiorica SM1]|uniref:Uncharacterized protein n=1 Tax=Rhodopirellula maiorica SM1 TaxID=1265738 RepID=M5RCT6_9BACT|nr:hypothetical protein RMSM_05877 [Rhodopirellula maiorica SM1]
MPGSKGFYVTASCWKGFDFLTMETVRFVVDTAKTGQATHHGLPIRYRKA